MKHPVAALCFEMPAYAAGQSEPPSTLTIIPPPGADGRVRGIDGRVWKLTNPEAVCSAFTRARAITENHARVLSAPDGGSAPAFGWIETIRVERGGIVADVSWTERGRAALNARDYRYFSPEFVWDEKTGDIQAVVGGGLTNDPNLPLLALNREQHPQEHPPMSLLAIATALGLTAAADEAACVTAITTIKTEKQTALNAAQTPDPTRFVPRAELDVALNRATTAEGAVAAGKKAQAEAEILGLIDEAQAAGKVIPATREHYLALCRQEGGADLFKKLLPTMQVIGGVTHTGKKLDAEDTGASGLTAVQLAICSATGIEPKKYAEQLKAAG